MKKTKYYVVFQKHGINVSAMNVKDAIILACAKSVENGNNTDVVSVINIDTNEEIKVKIIISEI